MNENTSLLCPLYDWSHINDPSDEALLTELLKEKEAKELMKRELVKGQ
jgi:hypothetical protein